MRVTLFLVFATLTGLVFAQADSTISYQGRLNQGGEPFNGNADLEFRLFDAAVLGNQLGPPIALAGVPVADGLFQVELDFGEVFDGESRWLEISVEDETLSPRQAVRPAPIALFALAGNEGPPGPEGPQGPEGTSPFTHNSTTGAIQYQHNSQRFRFEPRTSGGVSSPSIILGHAANIASTIGATVSGGGDNSLPNRAEGNFSSIGGGQNNRALGAGSRVDGGRGNEALGNDSAIGGGSNNTAVSHRSVIVGGTENITSATEASVGGGSSNTASGVASSVSGGELNCAGGRYSWAGGRRAKVRPGSTSGNPGVGCANIEQSGQLGDIGTFVWADTQQEDFVTNGSNRFMVRAFNGIWFGKDSSTEHNATRFINTSMGAYLTNGGTWTDASSRDFKTNFSAVDPGEIMERVVALPISRWRYRESLEEGEHLGPMAEDFYSAFGLGADDKSISSLDAAGVALVAIQGLNSKLEAENGTLRAELTELHRITTQVAEQNAELRERLAVLEAVLTGDIQIAGRKNQDTQDLKGLLD